VLQVALEVEVPQVVWAWVVHQELVALRLKPAQGQLPFTETLVEMVLITTQFDQEPVVVVPVESVLMQQAVMPVMVVQL
jgi:hypothetical protein